jgi:hypothetical protein
MQTNFFPALSEQVRPLTHAEMLATYGGDGGNLLMDAAAFLISPGFGFFYLGMKAGWQEAATKAGSML